MNQQIDNHILSLLQQLDDKSNLPPIETLLATKSLQDLCRLFQYTENDMAKFMLLSQIIKNVRDGSLDRANRAYLTVWIEQLTSSIKSFGNEHVENKMSELFALVILKCYSDKEDVGRLYNQLQHTLENDRTNQEWACRLFLLVINQMEKLPMPKSHIQKEIEFIYMNLFMEQAFEFLNIIVQENMDEEEEELRWDGDIQSSLLCLRLFSALVNYDFLGQRSSGQTDQFMSQRSPLLIPSRPHKFQSYSHYDGLKSTEFLNKLNFLLGSADNLTVKCQTLQLFGDLSRIQIKFFRTNDMHIEFCNLLMCCLNNACKEMKLTTDDDYVYALSYSMNIVKTIPTFNFLRLNQKILEDWCLNLTDFFKQCIIKPLQLIPAITKPILEFIIHIDMLFSTSRFHSVTTRPLSEIKLQYEVSLLELAEVRVRGIPLQVDSTRIYMAMEADPLLDNTLIEQYLYMFRHAQIMLQQDDPNCTTYQQLLWKIYMRFTHSISAVTYCHTKKPEKSNLIRKFYEQIVQCFSLATKCPQQLGKMQYKLYTYMLSKLLPLKDLVSLIKESHLPISDALSAMICYSRGKEEQILTQKYLYLADISNIDRERLYKLLIEKIQKHKGNNQLLHLYYGYCFIITDKSILNDYMVFINTDFNLALSNKLLAIVRKYELYEKFQTLMSCITSDYFLKIIGQSPHNEEDVRMKTIFMWNIVQIAIKNTQCHMNMVELVLFLQGYLVSTVCCLTKLIFSKNINNFGDILNKIVYCLDKLIGIHQDAQQLFQSAQAIIHVCYVTKTYDQGLPSLCLTLQSKWKTQPLEQFTIEQLGILFNYLPKTTETIKHIIQNRKYFVECIKATLLAIDRDDDAKNRNDELLKWLLHHYSAVITQLIHKITISSELSSHIEPFTKQHTFVDWEGRSQPVLFVSSPSFEMLQEDLLSCRAYSKQEDNRHSMDEHRYSQESKDIVTELYHTEYKPMRQRQRRRH